VKVAVLSIWGALSDKRSGLSFVGHNQSIVSIYIYLQFNLTLISTSMYYIYKADTSTLVSSTYNNNLISVFRPSDLVQ
jgi:hypothetical protein